jgi:hypothetical protein
LTIELIHAPKVAKTVPDSEGLSTRGTSDGKLELTDPYASQRIANRVANAPPNIRDIYEALASFLTGLGDDVQFKELVPRLKLWVAQGIIGSHERRWWAATT